MRLLRRPTDAWTGEALQLLADLAAPDANVSTALGAVIAGRTPSGGLRAAVRAGIFRRPLVRLRARRAGLAVGDLIIPSPRRGREWLVRVRPGAMTAVPSRLVRTIASRGPGSARVICAAARLAPGGILLLESPEAGPTADSRGARAPLLVRRSADGQSAILVRGHPDMGPPADVLKLDRRPSDAVPAIAPDHARAAGAATGVVIPRSAGVARARGIDVPTTEWVPGVPAAQILARDPSLAEPLVGRLAAWLLAWAERSGTAVQLDRDWLVRRLLAPAEELGAVLAATPGYLAHLDALARRVVGSRALLVAAHNDLTMQNVLVGAGHTMAVVDWDTWSGGALPHEDLHYAAVDAAMTAGRITRPDALAATLLGPLHGALAVAEASLAQFLGVPADLREVSLHACWLRHATRARAREGADGPFLEALRRLAAATSAA